MQIPACELINLTSMEGRLYAVSALNVWGLNIHVEYDTTSIDYYKSNRWRCVQRSSMHLYGLVPNLSATTLGLSY